MGETYSQVSGTPLIACVQNCQKLLGLLWHIGLTKRVQYRYFNLKGGFNRYPQQFNVVYKL